MLRNVRGRRYVLVVLLFSTAIVSSPARADGEPEKKETWRERRHAYTGVGMGGGRLYGGRAVDEKGRVVEGGSIIGGPVFGGFNLIPHLALQFESTLYWGRHLPLRQIWEVLIVSARYMPWEKRFSPYVIGGAGPYFPFGVLSVIDPAHSSADLVFKVGAGGDLRIGRRWGLVLEVDYKGYREFLGEYVSGITGWIGVRFTRIAKQKEEAS